MLIERLVETKIQPWLSKKLFTNKFENEKNKLIIEDSFEHWPLEDLSFEKFMIRETEIGNITISNNSSDASTMYEDDEKNKVVYNNKGFDYQAVNVDPS